MKKPAPREMCPTCDRPMATAADDVKVPRVKKGVCPGCKDWVPSERGYRPRWHAECQAKHAEDVRALRDARSDLCWRMLAEYASAEWRDCTTRRVDWRARARAAESRIEALTEEIARFNGELAGRGR